MTGTVRDYMNAKLVYLREGDRAETALRPILDFGITAVPVLDENHRPVGVVSLRDLVDERKPEVRATTPVEKIESDASLKAAAQAMTDADVHHLVVVDAEGRASGMISALDVVRGLLGIAPRHPRSIEKLYALTART